MWSLGHHNLPLAQSKGRCMKYPTSSNESDWLWCPLGSSANCCMISPGFLVLVAAWMAPVIFGQKEIDLCKRLSQFGRV